MESNYNKGGDRSSESNSTLIPLKEQNRVKEKHDKMFFDNLVWLTSEEARVYLRLSSREALRQLIYRGVILRPARIGRSYRFKKVDLDNWLESSRFLKRR